MQQKKGKVKRNKNIVIRVLNGEPISKLAEKHQVSPTRIRSILHEAVARVVEAKGNNAQLREIRRTPLACFRASKEYIINRL